MPSYNVQAPDGGSYTVDADTEDKAQSAINDVISQHSGNKVLPGMENSVMTPREPATVGNIAKNALEDVKGIPGSLLKIPGAVLNAAVHPIKTAEGMSKEGERLGMHDLTSGNFKEGMEKLGNATVKHPLGTFAEIMGAAAPVTDIPGAVGSELKNLTSAAPAAEEAAAAAPKEVAPVAAASAQGAPPAPPPVNLPPEIQDILNKAKSEPKEPPPAGPAPSPGESAKPSDLIPDEVKKFVGDKYQKIAGKPGFGQTVADYSKENARNMAMKSLGAAPGQIRKIGIPQAEKLADFALDEGIVGPKTGDIGARQKILKMNQGAGEVVGDMRQLVTQRGALHDMKDLLTDIHSKVGSKYESGIHSGEQGQYLKALQEVAGTSPKPDEMARTITKLFQESKNLDRLRQPSGAYADVARELRTANEGLMQKYLHPDELGAYHNALEKYGASTQLHEFVKRKQSTDMGGRLGPGSGITRMAVQKFADSVGYRTQAQIANRLAKFISENPEVVKSPKDLFRKYIDEASEAIDEMGTPPQ